MKSLNFVTLGLLVAYLVKCVIKPIVFADSFILFSLSLLCGFLTYIQLRQVPRVMSEADTLQEELKVEQMRISLEQLRYNRAKLEAKFVNESQGKSTEKHLIF